MASTIRGLAGVASLLAVAMGCTGQPSDAPQPGGPAGDVTAPSGTGLPGGPLSDRPRVELGYLVSASDFVTLWANGGVDTHTGTLFDREALSFHLVPADDMAAQVQRYVKGETPYLRATWGGMGQFYEQLCPTQDAPTCPLLVLQHAWSRGDHLVARDGIRELRDLKGKRVALQRGGPQLDGFIAMLAEGGLTWGDVEIVWKDQLVGSGSPSEAFRADPGLDAAWVITPDLGSLTGGLHAVGDGKGDTVAGAHVLVGTHDHPTMNADCTFVRQDHALAHPDELQRYRSAWLHALAEVRGLPRDAGSPVLTDFMTAMVATYGPGTLPHAGAALRILDSAALVGLPGNVSFAGDSPETVDHVDLSAQSLAAAQAMGRPSWSWTVGVAPGSWDDAAFKDLPADPTLADAATAPDTVAASTGADVVSIAFPADATAFDPAPFAADFDRVLAALGGGGTLVIRGHADPLHAVALVLEAGVQSGRIQRTGVGSDSTYTLDGAPLDVRDAHQVDALLRDPALQTLPSGASPASLARDARLLTAMRAATVRDALVAYAVEHHAALDAARIVVEGVGFEEPLVPLPRSPDESARNRRVELAILRDRVESGPASDYGW